MKEMEDACPSLIADVLKKDVVGGSHVSLEANE